MDGAALEVVFDGVVGEIEEELAESVAVGVDGDWDGGVDGDFEAVGVAEDIDVFSEVVDEEVEADWFGAEFDLMGVCFGEEGEARDDAVEAEGFVLPCEELFAFVIREGGVEEGAFEACVEDGEWGFEFVGGVEGEAADALEGLVESGGEVIEDPCEAVDFVAAAGDGEG